MERPEYDERARVLLDEFKRFYNPSGPVGTHNTQEARTASAAITAFVAQNWKPEWYKPFIR